MRDKLIHADGESDTDRVMVEAAIVAAFLNSAAPDFLTDAMLYDLDHAFDHFGLEKPRCNPQIGEGIGDYNVLNLMPLFRKTKLTSLDQIYATKRERNRNVKKGGAR